MAFKLSNSNIYGIVTEELLKISKGMNTYRKDFSRAPSNPSINAYYLLGFIEGDGCFSSKFNANNLGSFSVSQKITNRILIDTIFNYLKFIATEMGINLVGGNVYYTDLKAEIQFRNMTDLADFIVPFFL